MKVAAISAFHRHQEAQRFRFSLPQRKEFAISPVCANLWSASRSWFVLEGPCSSRDTFYIGPYDKYVRLHWPRRLCHYCTLL